MLAEIFERDFLLFFFVIAVVVNLPTAIYIYFGTSSICVCYDQVTNQPKLLLLLNGIAHNFIFNKAQDPYR